MSKNYRVQREANKFYVFETTTEQRIDSYDTYREASLRIVDLDRGVSFSGWHPSFFLIDIKKALSNLQFSPEELHEEMD